MSGAWANCSPTSSLPLLGLNRADEDLRENDRSLILSRRGGPGFVSERGSCAPSPVREAKRLNYPTDCAIRSRRTVWRESMELTDSLKSVLPDTAKQLKGSARRVFMARIVKELGSGGASRAERESGWNRKTIRKGTHEVDSGIVCLDAFRARGRKLAEEHLPNLLGDLKAIVDGQSQTDPQFTNQRLYTRLTASEVR